MEQTIFTTGLKVSKDVVGLTCLKWELHNWGAAPEIVLSYIPNNLASFGGGTHNRASKEDAK